MYERGMKMEIELIKQAMKGDYEALARLVNELKTDGYKIAYTILRNEDNSIEAYLNAVEKAFKKIRTLKEPTSFKCWFLKIVVNESKNIYKKNARVIYLEDHKDIDPIIIQNYEDRVDLEEALKYVPRDIQEFIRMKFYLGYKISEISEILSVPEGTIKGKMYSALKEMRKRLETNYMKSI